MGLGRGLEAKNNRGRIVLRATFTDGSEVIMRADAVPSAPIAEPSFLLLLGSGPAGFGEIARGN